jgi:hypothetical protein
MARLSELYGRLLDALVVAACILLLLMTVMIGADVVSRNLGGGGVPVSNELSEDILYLMTLLVAPPGCWNGLATSSAFSAVFISFGTGVSLRFPATMPVRSTSRRWSRPNGGRWRRYRWGSHYSRSNSFSACTG